MFYYIFRISDFGFWIPENPSFFGLIFRIFGLIRIRAKNPRIDNPALNLLQGRYLIMKTYSFYFTFLSQLVSKL